MPGRTGLKYQGQSNSHVVKVEKYVVVEFSDRPRGNFFSVYTLGLREKSFNEIV